MASKPLRLPELIGIGPGRTGSTWLGRVLEGHVDLPYGVEETQFFNTLYHKGIDWYARHFRYATGERPIVEVCPYFNNPEADDRIKLHIPNCRFIVTFRNPVDHAYSAYRMMRHFAWARGSFEENLQNRSIIFDRGQRYAFYLKRWIERFGRENIHITWYDDLCADQQGYIDGVCDFIGITRINLADRPELNDSVVSWPVMPKHHKLAQNARHVMYWLNQHQIYGLVNLLQRAGLWDYCYGRGEPFPTITPELELKLLERWLPEVEALEALTGHDLSAWKKPRADGTVGLARSALKRRANAPVAIARTLSERL